MSEIDSLETITHYTKIEGGEWLPWPKRNFNRVGSEARILNGFGPNSTIKTKYIHGVQVHSFRISTGREWDVLNGWRTKQ
jgi:hypothetical protein